uniref:PPIase cyclophilin-type domain-containing protein n=1 Tax=Rhodnius prolixus TaxID=13249 RepID=T1HD02_RHOPR
MAPNKFVDVPKSVVIIIKIRGIVTEPKCWTARYFANFAISTAPKRYEMDMKFLFELEWIHLKRTMHTEILEAKPECAVWINETYIGDDIALYRFLRHDEHIPLNLLDDIINVSVQISTNPLEYCPRNMERSYVYFNVILNGRDIGRMLFEIFNDLMPISCARFLKECVRYNGSPIHRIAHSGWFETGRFENEDHPIREKRPLGLSNCREGMLSLVNAGKSNSKSSTFLVTMAPATYLDPYQCPIGALLDGDQILKAIDNVGTHYDSPKELINIANVNILYTPNHVSEKFSLNSVKVVEKPSYVWSLESKVRRKVDQNELMKFRIDLKPDFKPPAATWLEQRITEIRRQLNQESSKFKQVVDEARFQKIVYRLLQKKQISDDEFDLEKLKMAKDDEKWYKILLNADSDFDLYYKQPHIPKVCLESVNDWLEKSSTIENPIILRLLGYVDKKELLQVMDLIKRLIGEAIEIAINRPNELYLLEYQADIDYSKPFGDDIDRLPTKVKNLLNKEVVNLTKSGVELLRTSLRHIIETISDTKLDDKSTISGNAVMIISATSSLLGAKMLSQEEVISRKESLVNDIDLFTKSIIIAHAKTKSEELPKKERHPAYFKSISKTTF